jgi:hypothetical protein
MKKSSHANIPENPGCCTPTCRRTRAFATSSARIHDSHTGLVRKKSRLVRTDNTAFSEHRHVFSRMISRCDPVVPDMRPFPHLTELCPSSCGHTEAVTTRVRRHETSQSLMQPSGVVRYNVAKSIACRCRTLFTGVHHDKEKTMVSGIDSGMADPSSVMWQNLFKTADTNGDGSLSMEEFKAMTAQRGSFSALA